MKRSIEELMLMRKRMWETAAERQGMTLFQAVFYAFLVAFIIAVVIGGTIR